MVCIGTCVAISADYKFNYTCIQKGVNIVIEVVYSSQLIYLAYITTLTPT